MTLEEIKKSLEFMDDGWDKMTEQQKKELAHIVIEPYRNICKELLKMVEDK